MAGNSKNEHLFRIVHITDMHIFPSKKVEKAMSKLLVEIHSLDEKPDFVLNTGDNIMDAFKRLKEDVHEQLQAWLNYLKNKLEYPMYPCIGNHDVWGWGIDDKTECLGVNYFCNGADFEGWWKGNYQEFGPAYAIVDLYKDGTATSELIPYKI
jgi:predicted MPP superfamily phosphohydrolase